MGTSEDGPWSRRRGAQTSLWPAEGTRHAGRYAAPRFPCCSSCERWDWNRARPIGSLAASRPERSRISESRQRPNTPGAQFLLASCSRRDDAAGTGRHRTTRGSRFRSWREQPWDPVTERPWEFESPLSHRYGDAALRRPDIGAPQGPGDCPSPRPAGGVWRRCSRRVSRRPPR